MRLGIWYLSRWLIDKFEEKRNEEIENGVWKDIYDWDEDYQSHSKIKIWNPWLDKYEYVDEGLDGSDIIINKKWRSSDTTFIYPYEYNGNLLIHVNI